MIRLSKSRFVAGIQCPKRLYLQVHSPELAAVDDATQPVMEQGQQVGDEARKAFAGGVLVEAGQKELDKATGVRAERSSSIGLRGKGMASRRSDSKVAVMSSCCAADCSAIINGRESCRPQRIRTTSRCGGYLSAPYDKYYAAPLDWLRTAGAEIAYIHSSGHASPSDLREFVAALGPKMVVPVPGTKWDEESHGFGAVRRLSDGETMEIP